MINVKKNPIAVILNIDSTSNLAPLYTKFCGIWQAEAKQMQWLFLQCSEVMQDGQFLRVTVSQDAPAPDVLLCIPMHLVLLVNEARGK